MPVDRETPDSVSTEIGEALTPDRLRAARRLRVYCLRHRRLVEAAGCGVHLRGRNSVSARRQAEHEMRNRIRRLEDAILAAACEIGDGLVVRCSGGGALPALVMPGGKLIDPITGSEIEQ